jgi:hypothetical protein
MQATTALTQLDRRGQSDGTGADDPFFRLSHFESFIFVLVSGEGGRMLGTRWLCRDDGNQLLMPIRDQSMSGLREAD